MPQVAPVPCQTERTIDVHWQTCHSVWQWDRAADFAIQYWEQLLVLIICRRQKDSHSIGVAWCDVAEYFGPVFSHYATVSVCLDYHVLQFTLTNM